MLYNILLIVQIIVALSIIGLVLIQHGKGADAGAAFGGGASGTVFGSKGSGSFLTRLTGILAAVFFANSLMLAWLVAHPDTGAGKSIIPTAITKTVTGEGATLTKPVEAIKPAVPSDVPVDKGTLAPSMDGAGKKLEKIAPSDIPK